MARKDIDGIEYVTKKYSYGESCDIASETFRTEFVDGKPIMAIDFGKRSLLCTIKGLKSWTFKGVDEDGNVKTEGSVLSITEENVRKIPPKHGDVIAKMVREENDMTDDEIKNSPGQ